MKFIIRDENGAENGSFESVADLMKFYEDRVFYYGPESYFTIDGGLLLYRGADGTPVIEVYSTYRE